MLPRSPIHQTHTIEAAAQTLRSERLSCSGYLQSVSKSSQPSTLSTSMALALHLCTVMQTDPILDNVKACSACLGVCRFVKQLLLLTLYAGRKSSAMASFMLDCSNVSGIVHCCCCSCRLCKPKTSEQQLHNRAGGIVICHGLEEGTSWQQSLPFHSCYSGTTLCSHNLLRRHQT